MKNDAKTKYLLNGVTADSFKDHFENNKIKTQEGECLIETLKRVFKEEIPCNLFYQAISGKGNESDKIDTIYSSSLQALLFFSQVSVTNKITINGITYSKVKFEHQNTVIPNCDPSCIDVCLMDDKENNVLL